MLGVPQVFPNAARATAASAPTFLVTATADEPDASAGDGVCATSSGACTLRAAIAEANAHDGDDAVIVVPAQTYRLEAGQGASAGDLDITNAMTIVGARRAPGSRASTIDGGATDRVFDVQATGVVLEGLVITNGAARTGAGISITADAALTLADSSVVANVAADQGGGIDNAGTLTVTGSTLSGNTATKKGGALHNAGSTTVRNVTVHGNTASAGGGVVTTGEAVLVHVTIAGNSSTNKLGGGVQRVGGTATIRASVVAGNASNSSDAKDCSGSPFLDGLNFIGNVQGCNPTGTAPLTGDAHLGALGNYGGPTQTLPLLDGSAAFDALDSIGGACAEPTDQRSVDRPQFGACDLGAFEVDPFGIDVDFAASATEIGAGAAVVPLDALLDAVAVPPDGDTGEPSSTALRSIALRSIALRSITMESVALRSIALRSIALRSIALRSIALRSIYLASTALRSIALRSILLTDVDVNGGWEQLLAGTEFAGVPLQTLTLDDVLGLNDPDINALTLEAVDLSETRLAALSIVSVLLGDTALRSIPMEGLSPGDDVGEFWCDLLGPGVCAEIGLSASTIGAASLLSLDLAGVALRSIALRSILLQGLDLSQTALRSITLADLAPGSVGSIVNCEAFLRCADTTATLEDVATDNAFLATATMAELLLALLGPEDLSWEDIDLSEGDLALIAAPQEPGFTYTATVNVHGSETPDVDVDVALPAARGFVAEPGSVALDGEPAADPEVAGDVLHFALGVLSPGSHELSFTARAGVTLGPAEATADAVATAPGEAPAEDRATTTIDVIEAHEPAVADDLALRQESVHIAHISYPGDVDYYRLEVPSAGVADGAALSVLLSNLPEDYDVALYGPSSELLRGEPTEQRRMLADHQLDLDASDDALTAEATADVPQTLPDGLGDGQVIHRIAARRDLASEKIEGVGLRGGTYWLQVSGANGVSSPEPYVLQTRIEGVDRGECAAPAFPYTVPADLTPLPALPDGLDTLFLVNRDRFYAAYDDVTVTRDAITNVVDLASSTNLGFVGGVVDLADEVLPYTAWDANRCDPAAANDVVRGIGDLIDSIAATHADLENIVIVGDDLQIPMARVADNTVVANERSFVDAFDGNDQLVAALAGGYVLTDNALASSAGIAVNDHELFVPERAVGRLVETPAEITALVESFGSAGGLLDPSTALVTGYDFLSDGADAVAEELATLNLDGFEELIDYEGDDVLPWDSTALAAALGRLEPAALASINAHFDHTRALPALGNSTGDETDLFTTADIDAVAAKLDRGLLFSMGCHSGLNVSDMTVGTPDWAQTFAGAGAGWVGNTGFGYGDTETVALSEELMALFAARLVAGDTVGEALSTAKQQYTSVRPLVSSYDEKVVHEAVLYGFPMLRVSDSAPSPQFATLAATGASVSNDTQPPLGVDPLTGLPAGSASFHFGIDEEASGPNLLTERVTDEGTYYHVDGSTLTQARRPVEPLTSLDVTRRDEDGNADDRARGVLITGLSSIDVEGFSPLFFSPTVDIAANEPRAAAADATFPSAPAAITSTNGNDGPEDRLVLVPGQFRRSDTAGSGTQRLFTDVDALVYYGDQGAPAGPPVGIKQTRAITGLNAVRFQVETDHPAERVYVLYKALGAEETVTWIGVDLVNEPSTNNWFGNGPASGPIEYTVQAVGPDGRVYWADGKGVDFGSSEDDNVGLLTISATSSTPPSNGWYRDVVLVAIAPGPGVEYWLDGVQGSYAAPIAIETDGAHTVLARNDADDMASAVILVDRTEPGVTSTFDRAAGSGGWHDGPVTVSLTAADALSGVASFDYAINGEDPVTVAGVQADVVVSGDGTTTIVARVTDRAGNQSETQVPVQIDTTAPSIAITSPSDGQVVAIGESVNAAFTCSDSASPVVSCVATMGGQAVALGAALPTATPGRYTLKVAATNAAGRSTEAFSTYTVAYRICLQYDPLQANLIGSTIPIKIQLCDASGKNLSSSSITVRAKSIDEGEPPPPNYVGKTNLGDVFRFGSKSYIYNLDTGSLTGAEPGLHHMWLYVDGVDVPSYVAPFTLRL